MSQKNETCVILNILCSGKYIAMKKNERVMLSSWVALKSTGFGACVWNGSEPVVWLNHSRCSKWRPFAFIHACCHVCHWLCRWCPEEYGPNSQVSVLSYSFNQFFHVYHHGVCLCCYYSLLQLWKHALQHSHRYAASGVHCHVKLYWIWYVHW